MTRKESAKRNARICELWDAGYRAHEITEMMGFRRHWTVHNTLRAYRPDRERRKYQPRSNKRPRPPTSWRTMAIHALACADIPQSEIARLLDVSRQRVSQVLRA